MPKSYSDTRLRRIYFSLPIFMREGIASVYSMTQHRHRFGGVFQNHIKELQANANQTTEEYAVDQLRRLRATLIYAGEHCPYYTEMFNKVGFEPNGIKSVAELQHLPMVDKETIRNQGNRLHAIPLPKRTMEQDTSGTTGSAMTFMITEEANQRHYATQWFHMSWSGIKWGERWALFGGQPVALRESLRPPFWAYDRYEKEMIFSCQHMTPDTMEDYARALADFQPAVICGIPSAIHLVALYLIDKARTDIRPKAVFTWAENTLAYQRDVIEKAFICRVYSSYGNAERTGHLLQCEMGNFHTVPETSVIEVVDSQGNPTAPGEVGELVCTSLMERAMPLIRYRIGDTAIYAEGMCSCGRTTPILSEITGRTHNYVIGRDGRRYGPLAHLFTRSMRIKEAQFVQNEPGLVCIRVVPRADYGPSDQASLLESALHKFGDQIDVVIQIVDSIPRTAGGKFQVVVTE
jgi:phenylacetate-CoA ligase